MDADQDHIESKVPSCLGGTVCFFYIIGGTLDQRVAPLRRGTHLTEIVKLLRAPGRKGKEPWVIFYMCIEWCPVPVRAVFVGALDRRVCEAGAGILGPFIRIVGSAMDKFPAK